LPRANVEIYISPYSRKSGTQKLNRKTIGLPLSVDNGIRRIVKLRP
jgi:hypothetical protein